MERFLDYFVPERYVLDIVIDKERKTIGGEVLVEGEILAEIVKFHVVELEVDYVEVNGKKVEFKYENGVLSLFKAPLGSGDIKIGYHGSLNENMEGAYLSTYEYKGKTEVIVATQFESHYAREAFPCIDEPAAKAVFELSISIPDGSKDIVLSNMPTKDELEIRLFSGRGSSLPSSRGSDPSYLGRNLRTPSNKVSSGSSPCYHTISFEPTPRMSTYLLAWVVGRFHGKTVKNSHGVEITTYVAMNQDLDSVDFANEVAAKSLEFYDDNFGVPYPLRKLDQVALPDFEAGAMENWGLVTYRESMLLIGKTATVSDKKSVALTVAHELSHQWFGDLVTMEWWDDLWLNESFASVMEYYAIQDIYPEFNIFESFFTRDCCAALLRDAYTGVQSVHQDVKDPAEIATLFDSAIVYAKGARLMLMLIRLMGWESFCKGIKDYFKKYQYKNAVGDDLWRSLKSYADFDPKQMMHAFIDRPGYPVITNEGEDFEKFSQKRFLLDGPLTDEKWPLPRITEDMSGHYVLNLNEKEFGERLENYNELGLEEKLRLLIDRDLITKSGIQSAVSLFPLVMKLKDEESAAIWNKIVGLIANLRVYFDDDSAEEKMLKEFVLKLIDKKMDKVGIMTSDDDDENMIRLRANLLGLDYFAEDRKRFEQLAKMYESNPSEMDNEIRFDILSAKVYLDSSVVDGYMKIYKNVVEPDIKYDYLAAATLVRGEKYLQKLVGLLGDVKVVKPQDQLHLFVYLYRNPKSRAQVFEWLTKNWDFVEKTGGEKTLSDYPMLVARMARTEDELERFERFFGPMREEPALSRAIEIGENEIRARIKMIQENQEAVINELKKY